MITSTFGLGRARSTRKLSLLGVGLCLLTVLGALTANADLLVTLAGERIETKGPWEVRGKLVVFTLPNGTLSSLRLSEVDLEASGKPTTPAVSEAGEGRVENLPSTPEVIAVVARETGESTLAGTTCIGGAGIAEPKGPPLPKPNPECGTIAVTVRGRAPAGNKLPAVNVYFVRLGQGVDMFAAESVIVSNFSKKKQVYLLNAQPGRYVAVAAKLQGASVSRADYKVFLDKALITQTEIEVTPGRIAFMGDFLIDLKLKISSLSDEAQAHYFSLIEPRAAKKGFIMRVRSGKSMFRGDLISVDRDRATQTEYWTVARDKVFNKEPAWKAKVAEELE